MQASIIIPAYNEEESLGLILEETIRKLANKIKMEIIVVDDGSADATYVVAQEAGAKTVRLSVNRGYGEAVKTGIAYSSFPNIVIFDPSGEYDPIRIIDGIKLITETKADIAVASYLSSRSVFHRLGSAIMSFALRVMFNLRIRGDISSTFICVRKAVFHNLELTSNDFSFSTELLIKANAKGFHIAEFPVKTRRRLGIKSIRSLGKLRLAFQYYSVILRNLGSEAV